MAAKKKATNSKAATQSGMLSDFYRAFERDDPEAIVPELMALYVSWTRRLAVARQERDEGQVRQAKEMLRRVARGLARASWTGDRPRHDSFWDRVFSSFYDRVYSDPQSREDVRRMIAAGPDNMSQEVLGKFNAYCRRWDEQHGKVDPIVKFDSPQELG